MSPYDTTTVIANFEALRWGKAPYEGLDVQAFMRQYYEFRATIIAKIMMDNPDTIFDRNQLLSIALDAMKQTLDYADALKRDQYTFPT